MKQTNIDNDSLNAKDLSEGFIQENLMKSFHYDERKYMEYLGEVKKSSRKWNSLGEQELTKLFPCFTILLEQYNEKIYSKRNKQERDLIKEGRVEGRSMAETKGRIVTSAGQFYLLLQKINIVPDDGSLGIENGDDVGSGEIRANGGGDGENANLATTTTALTKNNDNVHLEDLFDTEKIKVYIRFLEDLGKEPCTIRNYLLTLKFIIKCFLGSITFQRHQRQMIQASAFLDVQCAYKKAQNYNKMRQNAEDLFDSGHFMEEDEFALLVMFVLQKIQMVLKSLKSRGNDQEEISKKDENSISDSKGDRDLSDDEEEDWDNEKSNNIALLFRLQILCFTGIALLDGGLRREVVARLRVDSLIRKEQQSHQHQPQLQQQQQQQGEQGQQNKHQYQYYLMNPYPLCYH